MLLGRTLLRPTLTSHGNAALSGNFSCRKAPRVFCPVLPIELKTSARKPWNRNRKRGSSSRVVSSKISWENVGPRTTSTTIAQNVRCMMMLLRFFHLTAELSWIGLTAYGTDTRAQSLFMLSHAQNHAQFRKNIIKKHKNAGSNKKCTRTRFITSSVQRIA